MTFNNYAHFWCAKLVEKLMDAGIDHFFVAPGSRSTPIVSAIVRNPDAITSLGIDERSLGFMALGYGKKTRKAGVIVVTSGTAVANLYPAVTEAYMSRTPLLLLTADRPYELRDCGANQTIFQTNIFSNHINRSFDLSPPSPTVTLAQTLAIIDQARRETFAPRMGPVHVNVQLREPLANLLHDEKAWSMSDCPPPSPRKVLFDTPPVLNIDMSEIARGLSGKKGFLAVGEMPPGPAQEKILALATLLDWPIFADILSNMRLHRHPNVLSHFELGLLNKAFIDELSIDMVIKFGAHIVSKRFWSFIEKNRGAQLLSLSHEPERIDHTGRFEHIFVPDLSRAVSDLTRTLSIFLEKSSFKPVQCQHQKIDALVNGFLEKKNHNEGYFAARLVANIPETVNLFVSSSMPIRDLDQFAKPSSIPIDVYANRGASGIDGIISSAAGVAIGDIKPNLVLLGDVAFLHDTNGLMLVRETKTPMLIVVINNGGGAIFHFLPIAEEADVVTPYLDTPHNVSIENLCRAHDIPHVLIDHPKKFDDAIARFFAIKTTTVIEVIIDRKTNVALHKEIYKSIAGDVNAEAIS